MSKKLVIKENGETVTPLVTEVINQNGGGTLKFWYGTQEQYKALTDAQLAVLNADTTLFFLKD